MSSLSNDSSQSKSSESGAAPKPSAPELVHTESNSSLLIPDSSSRDGFYGYTDEKSLQHMEEKYWAHRRASDVSNAHSDTAASAGASSAPMSSLAPNLSYVSPAATFVSPATTTLPAIHEPDNGNSPFIESDDEGEDGDASKGRKVQVQVQAPAQPQSAIPLPLPPNFTSAPTTADPLPQPELAPLFQSLDRCLALRDKYMARSLQRLGDNPRDHDGVFPPRSGIPRSVSGAEEGEADEKSDPPHHHQPWKIYPPPPPPHWHVTDKPQPASHAAGESKAGEGNGFEFGQCEIPGKHPWVFEMDEQGVYQVYADESDDTDTLANGDVFGEGQGGGGSNELDKVNAKGKIKSIEVAKISGTEASRPLTTTRKPLFPPPTIREYFRDLDALLTFIADGPAKSFAYRRLRYLAGKFEMYYLVNEGRELVCMKSVPHRDFYNLRKVDTHVHLASCMNQKHLLRFIKSKMKRSPDDTVIFRDSATLTLSQVFESLKLSAYDLSIDTLDMHAHQDSFHRFDKFNLKYNPIGESRLREIFLKVDNFIDGRYLAELTKEVMADLEQSKYQNCEWRISVYGRSLSDWDNVAKWVINNKLFSHNVRWLVQIPRLYHIYKENGSVQTFEDVVRNVFQPLFEVTQDPSTHPELHVFLQRVIGLDSVDDESKAERRVHRKFPFPRLWDAAQNPPFSYWIYYMYANMASLNHWRRARGFNTLVLRPHAGEAGDPDHLTAAFLTSHSISHGILLRKVPALQYLFYLSQIGLAMSPLSNNALFLTYERNPLPDFFRTGLNVSLSTDDPLQFHFTKEPLLEEYSVAAHIYKLPQSSLAELARNSVIQSGFEMEVKRHWLGQEWYLPGAAGNDIHKTNVPDIRLEYRHNTLMEELAMIRAGAKQ